MLKLRMKIRLKLGMRMRPRKLTLKTEDKVVAEEKNNILVTTALTGRNWLSAVGKWENPGVARAMNP